MVTVANSSRQWVQRAFALPSQVIATLDYRRDVLRSAAHKFVDTTLGGNVYINTPPQFTETADLPVTSKFNPGSGLGRYYSEAFDDTAHIISLGFGLPEFRPLTQMFNNSYNPDAANWARKGRGGGFFYTLGKTAGFLLTVPLLPIVLVGRTVRFLLNKPSSKYYSLKPSMPLYWSTVNNIANGIAINMGIIPRAWGDPVGKPANGETVGDGTAIVGELRPGYTTNDLSKYQEMYPDLYRSDGSIDIFAVSTRAQRLKDRYQRRLNEELADATDKVSLGESLRNFLYGETNLGGTQPNNASNVKSTGASADSNRNLAGNSLEAYIDSWKKQQAAQDTGDGAATVTAENSWFGSFLEFAEAEVKDGARFVHFRVTENGPVSESFNNSTRDSDLAGTLNGIASQGRTNRFNFADGNIGDGLITNALESVVGSAKSFVTGALDAVGFSGLAALSGTAFFDLPKHWDNSDTNFPSSTYKLELRSPYGTPHSRFQNLMVPLSMLLAAALPLSTGNNTYTSPFLVELFDRGRNQIRLGIIDSLEITRGVGNLGWTTSGEPLGIDISFTVKDLTSVMHMPVGADTNIFQEDTAYTDYLATLGSLSLTDQIYSFSKLALNVTRRLTQIRSQWSPAAVANGVTNTLPGSILNGLARADSSLLSNVDN